jgi:hypothetical protein
MNKAMCVSAAIFVLCACGQSQPAPSAEQPASAQDSASPKFDVAGSNANADAKILEDFKTRVDEYDELRKDLAKKTPPLKKTEDPNRIMVAEVVLAHQIRAARANAKPGDIFTPATQAMFRRLLNPTMKGDEGVENKEAIKDDNPPPSKIPFKVNAEYPKEQALSTVPPDLLKALPPLPEDLQYRFAGKHLLLYCARANLIVDYMLNAIP